MIRPIIEYPDPILAEVMPATEYDPEYTPILAQDLRDTMASALGIGIAAPQIGQRIRAVLIEDEFFLNPRITSRSGTHIKVTERCLSVPNVVKQRDRNYSVKVQGIDERGVMRTVAFKGIPSACAQHELDHLNGKTILHQP